MKWFLIILTLLILFFFFPFTVTNKFGPYSGKVIDAETKKPIEGAAVLMVFYTEGVSLWTRNSYYADAVETVTDKNGEFHLPAHRVFAIRASENWDHDGHVLIFKPGYGCFPDHKRALPKFDPTFSLPEKKYVVVNLPRLEGKRERYENYSHCYVRDVPDSKAENTYKLIKEESEYIDKNINWRELEPGGRFLSPGDGSCF